MINHEEAQYTIRVIDIIQGLNEIDMYSPITERADRKSKEKIFILIINDTGKTKNIL